MNHWHIGTLLCNSLPCFMKIMINIYNFPLFSKRLVKAHKLVVESEEHLKQLLHSCPIPGRCSLLDNWFLFHILYIDI